MRPESVSAQALRYWEMRQAAVSNNLANVTTPGFKAERVFATLLDQASLEPRSRTDFSAGTLNPTGRPLDVALDGPGFLVVEGTGGDERWIRGGALSIDAEGTLVDGSGRRVLGDGGPIVLPPGEITISDRGEVRVDGADVGRLRIERPGPGESFVEREGESLWLPTAARTELAQDDGTRILQHHLEESNVDPVGALVEMIEIQRAYTAVERSMQTETAVMQTITTQIGRVG